MRVAADTTVAGVAALAPSADLVEDDDVVDAVEPLDAPTALCVGERDTTVDWEPIVAAGRAGGARVCAFDTDHFFAGRHGEVAADVAQFFEEILKRQC